MAISIIRGAGVRPMRNVLYGVPGIGKSTMAAGWPKPLFLDAEHGADFIGVDRVPIDSAANLTEAINAILAGEITGYETLVIDTADWVFDHMADETAAENGKNDISELGFGQGYGATVKKFEQLLYALDAVLKARGMHIVIVAHATTYEVTVPGESSYQQWTIKVRAGNKTISRMAAKMLEWADNVLFVNYDTKVIDGVGKGGKIPRIYTQRSAAYEAKNRVGLPEVLDRDIRLLAPLWGGAVPAASGKPSGTHARPVPAKPGNAAPAPVPAPVPAPAPAPAPAPRDDDAVRGVASVPPSGSDPEELGGYARHQQEPVPAEQQQLDKVMTPEEQALALEFLNSRAGATKAERMCDLPKALLQAALARPKDLLAKAAAWKGGAA